MRPESQIPGAMRLVPSLSWLLLYEVRLCQKVILLLFSGFLDTAGGGKALIGEFESQPNGDAPPFYIYGLTLTHKHLEEIRLHLLLTRSPVFVPSVGRFRQGMLICIPLRELPEGVARPGILDILCDAYENDPFIKIRRDTGSQESERVDPSVFEGTNYMELAVYSDAENERLLLVAAYDNLGKGASGTAIQNLNLMVGLPEVAGLGR